MAKKSIILESEVEILIKEAHDLEKWFVEMLEEEKKRKKEKMDGNREKGAI